MDVVQKNLIMHFLLTFEIIVKLSNNIHKSRCPTVPQYMLYSVKSKQVENLKYKTVIFLL